MLIGWKKTRRFLFGATLGATLIFASTFGWIATSTTKVSAFQHAASVVGFHAVDFKVENLDEPEGVDVERPRFSWKLFSQDLNETQSSYRLVVSKMLGGETVWDSGRVESDRQLYVEYEGGPLDPATEYMVELNVWNKDASRRSQLYSCFSTGLYPTDSDSNPWKGRWIGLKSRVAEVASANILGGNWIAFEKSFSLPDGFSVYRRSFEIADVDAIVASAANFSADNNSLIYLNGKELGTSSEYRYSTTRDLRPFLRDGKNVFAIKVGNVGGSPNPGGLLGAFYTKTQDGAQTDYFTDDSWKAIEGFDEAYLTADFDDSSWANASILAAGGAEPWNEVETKPAEVTLPARYLSNVYRLKKDVAVERAVVFISGLGYNECYINGAKLGDQICGPMYSEYDKRVPYNTYDATDYLKIIDASEEDAVEIGVVLGSGRFYAPRIETSKNYGEPRLLFQMQIEYADGSKDLVVSDETWKGSESGPIVANNDYDGEIYDARKATRIEPDSEAATLRDGESRYVETRDGVSVAIATELPVDVMDAPSGKLVSQLMPPTRKTKELKPLSLKEIAPGRWIYDFGQNFVGFVRLQAKGDAGTEIMTRFAETLIPDGPNAGELYVANLRTAKCRDIYTLRGDESQEVYEPRFTYRGFRFVELTGYPGTPDLETLTGCAVNTDLPVIGSFETSNPTLSRIYRNVEWGTRGNYLSIPTDCPQRDERQGWQGDRAAESKGEMYMFDNSTLYNKWLQDIEDTQLESGNVCDVCPAYWNCYSPNVTWPSAQLVVAQSLAVMRGDESAIAKHYDSRKKWIEFMLTFVEEDGTISKDNYGDWCVPPESPELIHSQDPARRTNPTLLATAYLIYDMKISADFADRLGKTDDARFFRERAAQMTKAFNDKFYNDESGCYDNATQTSCVIPLYFGLVPEEGREKLVATLTNNIETVTDKHIGTGLIGAQWLARVLSDAGKIDLYYEIATQRTYPSWGYMLEKGATTIWELWNGDTADPAMNSGNHVMLIGDLGIWFYEYLAGIKADENAFGFKHFTMRPNVVGDLTYVKASYDSARGLIASDWKLDDEKRVFVWNVAIPANASATISVPTTNPDSLTIRTTRLRIVPPENGEIRPVKYERLYFPFDTSVLEKTTTDGRVDFELGSGFYEITVEFNRAAAAK